MVPATCVIILPWCNTCVLLQQVYIVHTYHAWRQDLDLHNTSAELCLTVFRHLSCIFCDPTYCFVGLAKSIQAQYMLYIAPKAPHLCIAHCKLTIIAPRQLLLVVPVDFCYCVLVTAALTDY